MVARRSATLICELAGFLLLIVGCWFIWPPLGLLAAGGVLVLLAHAFERQTPTPAAFDSANEATE